MPDALAYLRSHLHAARLLGAVALASLVSLIVPIAARASGVRATHARSHTRIANSRCTLKRGKKSSSHRGKLRACTQKSKHRAKGAAKRTRNVAPNNGGLIVEALGAPPNPPTPPNEASTSVRENGGGGFPSEPGEILTAPIDSRYLTDVGFGTRSFWLQPWRAYLDTWPASTLREAVGINFNVRPADAEDTAQLLQDSGFKLARIQINWSSLSYSEPTVFEPAHLASITTRLTALHKHGLRPLILLDAGSGAPTPEQSVNLETTAAASAGAQTVRLTAASAAEVVPGKTGFNELSFPGDPDILISSVNSRHVATLSRQLLSPLAAGAHAGTTLLYAPFAAPKLANGEANPAFQATLDGWLAYVDAVCKEAASIVGPGGFDLEVWNELSFASQFLNAENYYPPAGEEQAEATHQAIAQTKPGVEEEGEREAEGEEKGEKPEEETKREEEEEAEKAEEEAEKPLNHKREVNKEIRQALLAETVAYVRNPANGISSGVGISDGFASQTPFPSGATAPLGLTALSKHPYVGPKRFPAEYGTRHLVPINALGERDTTKGSIAPLFTPTYQSLLPESALTAISTENLIRDVSPFTTYIYHEPHGRNVGPAGGEPPKKWVTEYNLSPNKATVIGPDEVTPATGPSATLTPADKAHFQAKVALRSLVSMVGKGINREYFYAAAPGFLSLISTGFFSAVQADPDSYPGDALGGETMDGLRNMLAQFQGPGPGGAARQLQLLSIAQAGNHAQFAGDGTTAHPSLYDRDVLAVFPFQSSPTSFVIPVYVMTRDLVTLYEPEAPTSDINRFDLPNESFQITLGNLPETGAAPSVSAYDPLRNDSTPARLVSRQGGQAVFEFAATDYPRILTIDYPGT